MAYLILSIILAAFLIAVHGLLYDLTYPMNNVTISVSGKPFIINVTKNVVKNVDYSFYYQSDEISTPTHLGTHLDAPCHFAEGQWCVSDIPIDRLYARPGYVLDISGKCAHNRDCMLTEVDLEMWIEKVGKIEDGAILLVKTGWSKYWPDRDKYLGFDSHNKQHFPGVSASAATLIVSRKELNVYGVGIEGLSVDAAINQDHKTHIILAQKNIYNLENVPSLAKLPAHGFRVTSLPIKIDGSSGSPVRIIAETVFNSASSNESVFMFIAVLQLIHIFVHL